MHCYKIMEFQKFLSQNTQEQSLLYRGVEIMEDSRKIDVKIIEKLNADSSIENQSLEQLRREYAEERAKKNPDYALVGELAMIIAQKEGANPEEIDVPECVVEIKRRASIKRRIFAPKRLAAACIPLVLLLGLNAYTINAQGVNVFKALVDFVQGGVLIGFEDEPEDVIELPSSENDKYGIREKCAEYGVYPLVPEYLPDGFQLSDITIDDENTFTLLVFSYVSGKRKISISYTKYHDSKDIPSILVPSDTHNITEKEINGQTMYILEEENQFTATFLRNNMIYVIFSDGLDYEECDKIVDSIK